MVRIEKLSICEEPSTGPPLVDEVGARLRVEKVQKILEFKNKHKGHRGFVLGNGHSLPPSHRLTNLDPFVTIGMNRTGKIYFSSYYVALDSPWFRQAWIPHYLLANTLFTVGDNRPGIKLIPGHQKLWSWDLTEGVCTRLTGTVALQLAVWFGLDPIYCLGFDGQQKHFDGTPSHKDVMSRVMPKVLKEVLGSGRVQLFTCTKPEEDGYGVLPYRPFEEAIA